MLCVCVCVCWCVCVHTVYVCMYACMHSYTRTHTHTSQAKASDVVPGQLDISVEADLEDELFLAELDRIEQVIPLRMRVRFPMHACECRILACACVCKCVRALHAVMTATARISKPARDPARTLPQSIHSHANPAHVRPGNEAAAPAPARSAAPLVTNVASGRSDAGVDATEAATLAHASLPHDASVLKQNVVADEELGAKQFRQFTVVGVDHVGATSRAERASTVLRLRHAPFHTDEGFQRKAHTGCVGDEGAGDGGGGGEGAQGGREHGECGERGSEGSERGVEKVKCGARAVLHDSWAAEQSVMEGDSIVLVNCGEVEDDGAWHLRDGGAGQLVVHPHVLISASRLGDMLSCPRKAVLQEMVKDGDMGKSAIIGNLVHDVFQKILCGDDWSEPTILAAISRAVAANLAELVGVGLSSADATLELQAYMKNIIDFFEMHRIAGARGAGSAGEGRGANAHSDKAGGLVHFSGSREPYRFKMVGTAHDIEEMVCSTRYGVQGRIDATVQVELHPTTAQPGGSNVSPVCVRMCVRMCVSVCVCCERCASL